LLIPSLESSPNGTEASSRPASPVTTLLQGVTGALLAGQAAVLFWGLFLLPTSEREALERGVRTTGLSVPELITELLQPDGKEKSLRRWLDNYAAMEWLNQNTPKEAKVLFFEETRGYYLDRFYLWGNAEHSSYIRYDENFQDGAALSAWL